MMLKAVCVEGRYSCFFFNDTATTEIYTLSLHDALPISVGPDRRGPHELGLAEEVALEEVEARGAQVVVLLLRLDLLDRKSTRLNSSHANISYAVFCLKKKKLTLPSHQGNAPVEPPRAIA